MPPSLLAITQPYHAGLNELFLLHQEALLERRFDLGAQILERLIDYLQRHIAVENELLLPRLDELRDTRWKSSLYRQEHDKINQLLARMNTRFTTLREQPSRRGLLALLDYQRTVKHVLEHHEEREEQAMIPELEAQLASGDVQDMCEQLSGQWPAPEELAQCCAEFRRLLG